MKDKVILVLEGPSGSGKTTIAKLFAEKMGINLCPRPPWFNTFRDFGIKADVLLSQTKDFWMLNQALLTTEDQGTPLIDRLLLSQVVYGAIRRGTPVIPSFDQCLAHLTNLCYMIDSDIIFRDQKAPLPFQRSLIVPSFLFIILLPSAAQLEKQRAGTKNYYPFPAELEISFYNRFRTGAPNDGPIFIPFWSEPAEAVFERIVDHLHSRLSFMGFRSQDVLLRRSKSA